MKNLKLFVFALISFMVIGVSSVNAKDTIKTLQQLEACLSSDIVVCTIGADIEADDSIIVGGSDVTLDLNGHTISLDVDTAENAVIVVEHGAKLTIKDSSENKTGKISYITDLTTTKVRTAIKLTKKNGDNKKVAELVVDGGTLEGDSYAISGNGSKGRDNTKVTINGGTIYSKETAIFQPQVGDLIVNGGSIEGRTAIEIRSGRLEVNGGTITGTGKPTESEKNGNGTTTTGAGIAVVQHRTTHEIEVVVNGGNIKGYTPFYQASIEDNSNPEIVSLSLIDGTFTVINDGENAVYSGDKTAFIEGGTYSANVTEGYLATGLLSTKVGNEYIVGTKNKVNSKVTAGTITFNKTNAVVGETIEMTLTPNEGYKLGSITVIDAENKEVTVENNKFVMPNSEVTVTVVFVKITTELPIVDVAKEVTEVMVGVKEEAKVEEVLHDSLVKENLELDSDVKIVVEIEKVDASKIAETVTTKMEEAAGDATIAEYFDINVLVKNAKDNSTITNLTNLTEEIELMILLPEELKNSEEGMTRKYYVVREHDSKVELLETSLSEDGKYLVFKTDKFSNYALAYEDVKAEVNTPQTGDNITLYIALGFISVAVIGMSLNSLKRRATR